MRIALHPFLLMLPKGINQRKGWTALKPLQIHCQKPMPWLLFQMSWMV
jgi:hypothetical protein